uniref:Ras GTPase-activating-like protein rgaA n=1 Tax=Anthurium amnicola TaxID=1678845 RepID=A0A1D1Y4L1_9ARAE
MKFTTIISTLLIGSSLLFSPASACESACQVGISKAFADKYGGELKPFFDRFKNNLANTILQGVDLGKVGHGSKVKTNVPAAIKTTVDQLKNNFVGDLQKLVFDSIFVEKPQYKGDCNHPKLVQQPKKGVPWQRSDCDKQTYLCGNPPAICHDIQKIKIRIFTNIHSKLNQEASSNGPDFKALSDAVWRAARSAGVSLKNRRKFLMPLAEANIRTALSKFLNDSNNFCHDTCPQYDDSIITLLLSFP